MGRLQSPYHLLSLPILAMAAVLLIGLSPPAAAELDSYERTDKDSECVHDLVVAPSAQPAESASLLDTEFFSHYDDSSGLNRYTDADVVSPTQTSGAFLPRTTAERLSESRLATRLSRNLLTPYRQRAFARCPRTQAMTA